jgi:hypothetical protein
MKGEIAAAWTEFENLFGYLRYVSGVMSSKNESLKHDVLSEGDCCLIRHGGITLVACCRRNSDSSYAPTLEFDVWTNSRECGHIESSLSYKRLYTFDHLPNGVVGWRATSQEQEFLETKALAELYARVLSENGSLSNCASH